MLDTQIGLDWSSYTVMGLYLLAVIAMGAWFRRGKVDTETYLLGGRSMPWFVIGISYFVSLVSTVSMVSGPGEAYEYGVAMAIGVLIPFAWFDNFISDIFWNYFGFSTGLIFSGSIFCLIFLRSSD